MKLASLPPDILGEILSNKHASFLTIALWKCGDSQLNHKLASSVTYLRLKDNRINSTSRYPKLLSQLKALRHLDLSRGKWHLMGSPSDLRQELQSLAGTKLETLRITSADSVASLLAFSHEQKEALGLKSRLWDLSEYFPILTTLKISKETDGETDIAQEDFAGLPSTITRLITPVLRIWDLEHRFCATLPRSLQIWQVNVKVIEPTTNHSAHPVSDLFWDDPPPNLEKINPGFQLYDRPPTTFERMPKSLKQCWFNLRSSAWTVSLYQSLPPYLKSLCSSLVDMKLFPSLTDYRAWKTPQHITSLHFHNGDSDPISAQFIASLPPTITSLSQPASTKSYFDWDDMKNAIERASLSKISFWPPLLTDLELGLVPVPPDVLEYFPPTLRTLGISWDSPELASEKLPRNILSMMLGPPSRTSLRILPGLPPKLQTIMLNEFEWVSSDDPFPASITEIYTDGSGPPSSTGELMPITLPLMLRIAIISMWESKWLPLLPPTLSELNIQALGCSNDTSLDDDLIYFESMPSGLESVSLTTSIKRTCTQPHRIFAHLTKLNKLDVAKLAYFEPKVLAHLPQSLTSLEISLSTLDEETALFLGPKLIWLSLSLEFPNHELVAKHWPPLAPDFRASPLITENRNKLAQRASLYPDPRTIAMYS